MVLSMPESTRVPPIASRSVEEWGEQYSELGADRKPIRLADGAKAQATVSRRPARHVQPAAAAVWAAQGHACAVAQVATRLGMSPCRALLLLIAS